MKQHVLSQNKEVYAWKNLIPVREESRLVWWKKVHGALVGQRHATTQ